MGGRGYGNSLEEKKYGVKGGEMRRRGEGGMKRDFTGAEVGSN